MNLLFVGNGKGSWTMRGQQLGARLDARVATSPTPDDWKWADLAVLVKNYGAQFAREAMHAGVPVVWDALDFWRQPFDNRRPEADAKTMLAQQIAAINPVLVIGATQAMADACGGAYLPHHSWRGLEPSAPRPEAKVIAYEGNPAYLGRWAAAIQKACQRSGAWTFVVNPPDLEVADVIVALRDGDWDGWMCREWKSGVKLSNAIAAGRPVLTQPSAAVRELQPVHILIDGEPNAEEIEWTLESFAALDFREYAYDVAQHKAKALRLPAIADRYRSILTTARATTCHA